MWKIENLEQFVTWAKEVNMGTTTARKCELQDIIARSNFENLKKLFCEAKYERDLILCSIYNTMSYQFVEDMLKALAKHMAQEIIEKEEYRYMELNKQKIEISCELDEARKKISVLQDEIARLVKKCDTIRISNEETINNAKSFLTIKNLLKEA